VRWSIDPVNGNSQAVIISNNSASSADIGQFWLQHASSNEGFQFGVKTTVGQRTVDSNTRPVINQWYHVAGVYNGSTVRAFIINGAFEKSEDMTGNIVADSNYPLTIGRWEFQHRQLPRLSAAISTSQDLQRPDYTPHKLATFTTKPTPALFIATATHRVISIVWKWVRRRAAISTASWPIAPSISTVVAVKADGTVETGYVSTTNKTVSVELVDAAAARLVPVAVCWDL